MKFKLYVILGLLGISHQTFSQSTPGVKWENGKSTSIISVDLNSYQSSEIVSLTFEQIATKGFVVDQKRNLAMTLSTSGQLSTYDISNNQFKKVSSIMVKSNFVGFRYDENLRNAFFIEKDQEFNGYQSSEDNLTLVKLDLSTGLREQVAKIKNLRIPVAQTPFIGMAFNSSFFTNGTSKTEKFFSISNSEYIPELKYYMISFTDVMGTNRMYTFDVENNTFEAPATNANIIDIMYIPGKQIIKVLYSSNKTNANGFNELFIGDWDLNSKKIVNSVLIDSYTNESEKTTISNGVLNYNNIKDEVYVSAYYKKSAFSQLYTHNFILNADDHKVKNNTELSFNESIYFAFDKNNVVINKAPTPFIKSSAVAIRFQPTIISNETNEVKVIGNIPAEGIILKVSDLAGNTVNLTKLNEGVNFTTLDFADLSNGMYFINYKMNGEFKTQKIIVSR